MLLENATEKSDKQCEDIFYQ